MPYETAIDREITVAGNSYSVLLEAELDYSHDEDPECTGVEITQAEVAPLEGDPLPLGYEGRSIEKLVVQGHPELTEAIDGLLWDKIQTYTEDNYRDLMRDLRDAANDYRL